MKRFCLMDAEVKRCSKCHSFDREVLARHRGEKVISRITSSIESGTYLCDECYAWLKGKGRMNAESEKRRILAELQGSIHEKRRSPPILSHPGATLRGGKKQMGTEA
jgi:nitrate/TMAO reductase-like tetraheme cytochrome c subunit